MSDAQAQLLAEKAETEAHASGDAINQYFNDLSLLTSVRIALQLPVSSEWARQFYLKIDSTLLARLPGLAAPQTSHSGDRYFNLVVESSNENLSILRLSQSHLQGLEVAHLAQNPTQDAYLTLVQFLVSRQLLKNYAAVESLHSAPSGKSAVVSSKLVSKMQSLGLFELIAEEQKRVEVEERARGQLAVQLSSASLPSLADDAYAASIAARIAPKSNIRAALSEVLRQSESTSFKQTLQDELDSMPLLFSAPLPVSAKTASLREIISNAKAQTQVLALAQIEVQAGVKWTDEKRRDIAAIVEKARVRYSEQLQEASMKKFLDDARAGISDSGAFAAKRAAFVQSLKDSAPEISRKTRDARAGLHVDPAALVRSYSKQLNKLDAGPLVRQIVFELSRERDFASMRGGINEYLLKFTGPTVLTSSHPQAAVDPDKVRAFVDGASCSPDLKFQRERRFGDLISREMDEDQKKDIRQLDQIGRELGLLTPNMDPGVSVLFPKPRQQETYFTALSEEILTRYPLLNLQPDGKTPLYELLTRDPGSAETLVEKALQVQQAQIQSQLDRVGDAKALSDLESAITQSMLIQSALSEYPEFRQQESRFIGNLTDPDFGQQLLRRYVNPSVAYGFGALLLLQGTKWIFKDASPWINAVLTGLSPFIRAFTRYAVISMIADTAYQFEQTEHARAQREQIQGLTLSSTGDGSFFDQGQMHGASSAYHWAIGMFLGRLAIDGLLMYRPMVFDLVREVRAELSAEDYAGDIAAFEKLGLKPGDWESINGRMDVLKRTSLANDAEAWHQTEMAALRLKIRMRANEIWSPSLTPSYRRLIQQISDSAERAAS